MKSPFFVALMSASPTINLPHAAPTKSHIQVGSGAAIFRAGPLPSARLAGELNGKKLGFKYSSTSYVGQAAEHFQVAGLRYLFLHKKSIRLAPYMMVAQHLGISSLDHRMTGRIGLAIDTGGSRWRYDGSLSLYGLQYFTYDTVEEPLKPMNVFEATLLGSEHGVSCQINKRHQLRIGLLGVLPSIRYQWAIPKGPHLSTTIATLGPQNILQIELGTGF